MDNSKLPAQQQSHVRHTYPLQHKVYDSNRKKKPTHFSLFNENLIHKGKKQHDCPPCRSKHISSFSVFKDIHVKQFLQLYRQAGTIPSCNSKKHFSFRLFFFLLKEKSFFLLDFSKHRHLSNTVQKL